MAVNNKRVFKPHRGNKSTMISGVKKNTVLKAGEMFIELPDNGQGAGKCRMKIGDGATEYPNLPYAMGDTENESIAFTDDSSATVADALTKMYSGNKLNILISSMKRAIELLNAKDVMKDTLLKVYPVGAIFFTTSATNPSTYLGFGSWSLLQDRFLVGAGGSYAVNATGGANSVTLNVNQIPSHTHRIPLDNFNSYKVSSPGTAARPVYQGNFYGVNTIATGGGGSHENRPPYLAVYMWKRTA